MMILLACASGIGTIFSFLISDKIRGYNRISIFIAYTSILAFCIVLDYLYNASNIEDFYKNAYTKADIKNKDQIGLYYAIYLQKNGDYKKAISLLRGIEIFASEKYNIPTKIAYAYKLSSIKEDIKTNSYLKVKKIDLKKIEENIGDCNN